MCLAQGHNEVTLVTLEPATPLYRIKHSQKEKNFFLKILEIEMSTFEMPKLLQY